ncbi:MAG: Gfo/Idh/MocA family oxidoreductase [Mariniphaga sp.]|nr:Gfo/Idh/MocA family oxidoreductase [Mariniphaga sp.]
MQNKDQKSLSRRKFLSASAAGFAGVTLLPSISTFASTSLHTPASQNIEIKMAVIGLGRRGMTLTRTFLQDDRVKIVAGCDVYGRKRTRFENVVQSFYAGKRKNSEVKTYERFEELINRKDIDAVVIATPDHWHAIHGIATLDAGKDVYMEKPMTFTVREGQELVKAVRRNGRIMAVGSQQRSDPNFQHAVRLVQTGQLGKIHKINADVGDPPKPYNLPQENLPEDLNWDLWLGPLPKSIHFNHELNPPISLQPAKDEEFWAGWRWYKEMGGGFTTDWGAHMFDIAQWAMGKDQNGPVEVAPIGDGSQYMTFKYANGTVLTSEPYGEGKPKGVKFWGENGWIEVAREYYEASDKSFYPTVSNDQSGVRYEEQGLHYRNFVDSVFSRLEPAVPVEVGHSSCVMCTIGNIACDLKSTLKWDPVKEKFYGSKSKKANKKLHYSYRTPWKL